MTRRGRPPKDPADRQRFAVHVYCTAEHKAELTAAAERRGLSVSGFVLQSALSSARSVNR